MMTQEPEITQRSHCLTLRVVHLVIMTFAIAVLYALPSAAQVSMNVELLSNLDFGPEASDIWGYVDDNGNEYAIMGLTTGTVVINVTDPVNPELVGTISGPASIWRDIKTYSHYAYVVEDQVSSPNALQIIDLSNLPNSISLAATYSATFTHAHNLYIDVEQGFAYVVGGNVAGGFGGIVKLTLANPLAPFAMSLYANNYVHDIYVRNDTAYASAIFDGRLQIIRVRDFSMSLITEFNTVPHNFTHNAWTTDDGRYVATTDEVTGGSLKIWDLADLDNVELIATYTANSSAIIHNVIIKDQFAYIAYYTEGLRVVDISDPGNPAEVAFYDTWPGASGGYNGAWGVYPFLPSTNVLLSDIQSGLYVFALSGDLASRVTANVSCPEVVRQGCTIASGVEVDVSGTIPQQQLGSYHASLTWDPTVLAYVGFSGGDPPFDSPVVNEDNASAGELAFEQSDPSGAGGRVNVINVEFEVIGEPDLNGQLDLSFAEMTAAGTLDDLLPLATISNCGFLTERLCLLGDVTVDDEVSVFDALIVATYSVGLEVPPAFLERVNQGCGDVTQDNATTVFDALVIASFSVGLPVAPYPVAEPLCP